MLPCSIYNVCVPYIVISVGAVHPYYESRRRLLNDSRPGRGESAKKARHNARKKELRKRVSVVSNDHSLPYSQASVPAFVNWSTNAGEGLVNFVICMLGRHLVAWQSPRDGEGGGNGLWQDVNKAIMIAVVLVLASFLGLPVFSCLSMKTLWQMMSPICKTTCFCVCPLAAIQVKKISKKWTGPKMMGWIRLEVHDKRE